MKLPYPESDLWSVYVSTVYTNWQQLFRGSGYGLSQHFPFEDLSAEDNGNSTWKFLYAGHGLQH